MNTEKLQRRFDSFSEEFIAPLLTGKTVIIDQPIAPGAVSYFQHASTSDSSGETISDALHRSASGLAPLAPLPWPQRSLVMLAIASHNLVAVTDPAFDRVFARGARTKILAWVDEIIESIVPPETRADALLRHAILDPLPTLRRRDVVAKSWAYTYRFHGRPVGSTLLTRPVFGSFDETEQYVDLHGLFGDFDEAADLGLVSRLRDLLARSPITELLRLDLCASFRFGLATLSVLSDGVIRGAVAREIVRRGEWDAAARLGAALGDPALATAPPAHLYYALALCFETQMTATLDVPGPALPKRLDLSHPDVARYAAVLPAFFEDPSMLDDVRAFAPADRVEVQDRCGRLRAQLPSDALADIEPLVARCQRPDIREIDSLRESA